MEASKPGRQGIKFVVLALLLAAIIVACVVYWLLTRGFETTDDAQIDGAIYTIAPRISGRVKLVTVDDNQHVAAGQVLVVLDDGDQQAMLAKAQAEAAQAHAQIVVANAQASEAAAAVTQSTTSLTQAKQDFERYQRINQRAITQQQSDAVTAAIETARAKQAQAAAREQAAQASVIAANAQEKSAVAELENAQLQLSYTRIIAPAFGHVATKTVEPGNVVQAGTAMMAITGDVIWVTANFKETQLAHIHKNAEADINIDAVPGISFKAHVDSIQYGTGAVFSLLPAQNATGNYVKVVQRVPVKIVFDDSRISKYLLAPGMSVEPRITLAP